MFSRSSTSEICNIHWEGSGWGAEMGRISKKKKNSPETCDYCSTVHPSDKPTALTQERRIHTGVNNTQGATLRMTWEGSLKKTTTEKGSAILRKGRPSWLSKVLGKNAVIAGRRIIDKERRRDKGDNHQEEMPGNVREVKRQEGRLPRSTPGSGGY